MRVSIPKIDHRSYAHNLNGCEIKAWKKIQAWTRIEPINDLCDTDAVLYQLSYQANRELVTLCVRNAPVESEDPLGLNIFSGYNFTTV